MSDRAIYPLQALPFFLRGLATGAPPSVRSRSASFARPSVSFGTLLKSPPLSADGTTSLSEAAPLNRQPFLQRDRRGSEGLKNQRHLPSLGKHFIEANTILHSHHYEKALECGARQAVDFTGG